MTMSIELGYKRNGDDHQDWLEQKNTKDREQLARAEEE